MFKSWLVPPIATIYWMKTSNTSLLRPISFSYQEASLDICVHSRQNSIPSWPLKNCGSGRLCELPPGRTQVWTWNPLNKQTSAPLTELNRLSSFPLPICNPWEKIFLPSLAMASIRDKKAIRWSSIKRWLRDCISDKNTCWWRDPVIKCYKYRLILRP